MKEWISEKGEEMLTYVAEWLESGAPHVDDVLGFDMNVGVMRDCCGTVCCIAGAVCQFFKPFDLWGEENGSEAIFYGEGGVFVQAQEMLGVSDENADKLFTPGKVDWESVTPEDAAKVIRHFIATGEVNWKLED